MSSKFSLNNFTLGAFTTELGKVFQTLVIRWKNEHLTVLQFEGCTNTFKLWPRMITLVLKMSDVKKCQMWDQKVLNCVKLAMHYVVHYITNYYELI